MRQPRSVEDIGFDYNPVTKRFEAVRSVREKMLLDLWSIDPAEWESAEWRFEGTLFARKPEEAGFYATADGFHPTGTVIDEEKGVQHIFIYSGHPCGPAGSFRINPDTRNAEALTVSNRALPSVRIASIRTAILTALHAAQGPGRSIVAESGRISIRLQL